MCVVCVYMYVHVDIVHVCIHNRLEESYVHINSEVFHFEKSIEECWLRFDQLKPYVYMYMYMYFVYLFNECNETMNGT